MLNVRLQSDITHLIPSRWVDLLAEWEIFRIFLSLNLTCVIPDNTLKLSFVTIFDVGNQHLNVSLICQHVSLRREILSTGEEIDFR